MTVYARSDVMGVAPSRDGHGGCGQVHSRPVEHGAPVKLWALDCPQCETFLRHDDQWSVTVSGIPETPDETAEREEREKRGQQEATAATGSALQEIAKQGGVNQQVMLAMLTALTERGVLNSPAPTVACANSHQMPATAKFCPECGKPRADELQSALSALKDDSAWENKVTVLPPRAAEPEDAPDFEAMTIRELQTYAAARGIKTTRGKADQIELIRAALSG